MTPSRSRCWLALGLAIGAPVLMQAVATAGPPSRATARSGGARAAAFNADEALKFETYQDQKKEHRWRLKAANGQIIATSGQGYKDKRDCKSAIDRIKKDGATRLTFETYEDARKEHRWRLKATNGQTIASSGQGYKDRRDCEHAVEVIKKGAEKAKVEEAAAE